MDQYDGYIQLTPSPGGMRVVFIAEIDIEGYSLGKVDEIKVLCHVPALGIKRVMSIKVPCEPPTMNT